MPNWNYRLIRKYNSAGRYYAVAEVYYDDDGSPASFSEVTSLGAEDKIDLLFTLSKMAVDAFCQPVLQYKGGRLIEVEPEMRHGADRWRIVCQTPS